MRELTVTYRLSEDVWSILEEQARREGRSMEDVVAEHALQCRPRRVQIAAEEAERRHQELVAMFGTFDSGDPHSADNDRIDEDLCARVRERPVTEADMFSDTSGLFSLYDVRETHHNSAERLFAGAERRVTTNYVLAELVPLMMTRGAKREPSIRFIERLQSDSSIEIVWVSEHLHRVATDFLLRRLDKNYSLCDAVSFIIMENEGITEALTTDHHFEQEGFVRLLH